MQDVTCFCVSCGVTDDGQGSHALQNGIQNFVLEQCPSWEGAASADLVDSDWQLPACHVKLAPIGILIKQTEQIRQKCGRSSALMDSYIIIVIQTATEEEKHVKSDVQSARGKKQFCVIKNKSACSCCSKSHLFTQKQ